MQNGSSGETVRTFNQGTAHGSHRMSGRPSALGEGDPMEENGNGRKYISHHILPTAANLLGLCSVILSFIKVMKIGAETAIDELVAVAIVIFLVASIFSYASIRSETHSDRFEKTADIVFIAGLGLLTVTAIVVVFEIV
jgi:uncharacterized membrane protein